MDQRKLAVASSWMLITVLIIGALPTTAQEQGDDAVMEFTVEMDFGEDRGQNYGSLFEAKAADDALIIGAGFMGAYNTRLRSDRYSVQMFIRQPDRRPPLQFEPLPRPSELAGTYLFAQDGTLYARDRADEVIRVWNEDTGAWEIDANTLQERIQVAGKMLVFGDSAATYEDRQILQPPEKGSYHGFYYGGGHLLFYHTFRAGESGYREWENDETGFSKLYACPWRPGDEAVDLSQAVVKTLPVVGETPFAWGQLDDEMITCSNIGGVYVFDGQEWRTEVEPVLGTSYQIYTMVNVYDRLLMGQYPTGELFEYDGDEVRHLEGQPPVIEGVAHYSREAQTAALYGGDLWVGVWPWAELWRYNLATEQWSSEGRMFTHPEVTDEVGHPYQEQAEAHDLVLNQWGQRITSLVPLDGSLYIGTSAKWPCEFGPAREFMADETWREYGRVLRMAIPGTLSAPVPGTDGPITLQFAITDDSMSISRDGETLASAELDEELSAAVTKAEGLKEVQWGKGVFGAFAGASLEGSVDE